MAQTKIVYDAVEAPATEETMLADLLYMLNHFEGEKEAETDDQYPKKMKITIIVEDVTTEGV